jgi:hypothetical protein
MFLTESATNLYLRALRQTHRTNIGGLLYLHENGMITHLEFIQQVGRMVNLDKRFHLYEVHTNPAMTHTMQIPISTYLALLKKHSRLSVLLPQIALGVRNMLNDKNFRQDLIITREYFV